MAAATSSVTRVPCQDAITPHSTLPTASAVCTVTNPIATARARTHAGAALCVPAPRLANTPTQDAPAPKVPTIASGMCSVAATSVAEITHRSDAASTMRCSECLLSARGMLSAATTAPAPKLAEQEAEAARVEM